MGEGPRAPIHARLNFRQDPNRKRQPWIEDGSSPYKERLGFRGISPEAVSGIRPPEVLTLNGANRTELHINVREEMVLELAQLQSWLTEKVIEKRVAGRDSSSIDPDQEKKECLGSDGTETISAAARIIHDSFRSKTLGGAMEAEVGQCGRAQGEPPADEVSSEAGRQEPSSPLVHP